MKWVEIQNFPDYFISDNGLVKSTKRLVKRKVGENIYFKTVNERILKPSIRNGYFFVTLRKDGFHKCNMIHHLVADAFIGKRLNGLVINHIDGNKLNNNATNLEYVSKQKNTKHYYQMIGKSLGGIPISDIPKIIDRIEKGEECYKIALEYNVSRNDISTISKIILI